LTKTLLSVFLLVLFIVQKCDHLLVQIQPFSYPLKNLELGEPRSIAEVWSMQYWSVKILPSTVLFFILLAAFRNSAAKVVRLEQK
jgi:hypothetical protein